MKDKVINNVLSHQDEDTGPFIPYTPEELTRIIQDLEKDREIVKVVLERIKDFLNNIWKP
jgi:ethanolamine ammonia-lyase large subunit